MEEVFVIHMQDTFKLGLAELDLELGKRDIQMKLVVIGAFALQLLNISGEYTADIDSVEPFDNLKVQDLIIAIAKKFNLKEDWINDNASSLDLPDGFYDRITPLTIYKNIHLFIPARLDLISLKARAYLHRGEIDKKDYEDLKRLKPTKSEIAIAIAFVRKTSTPPEPDFFPDFEDVLKEIENVAC